MNHRKPPAPTYAIETRDTSDEYAKHRIMNCESEDYLTAIIEKEAARTDPRQQRIAWANQRLAEVRDDE